MSPNGKKEYTAESTGSGFSEFLGSFDDSKVQFGLARVSPPGSDVQKLILIGWCPDSAPLKTRASFASNFGVVANQVLKSYHVQVTARDEDDLDEGELLMKISNAAGARYSIQQEPTKTSSAPKPRPAAAPKSNNTSASGASSKPTSTTTSAAFKPSTSTSAPKPAPASVPKPPVTAHQQTGEDDDWDEPEIEERDFRSKPLKPNQSTYKPVGKVDLQKLIAEENSKQDPRLVNMVKSEAPAKINPQADIDMLKQKSKAMRDADLDKYLGTRPPAVNVPQKSDDKIVKGFRNEKSPAQLWAEKRQQQQHSEVGTTTSSAGAAKEEDNIEDEDEATPEVSKAKEKFEKLAINEPQIIKPGVTKTPAPVKEDAPSAAPRVTAGRPLPGMHTELDNDKDDESEANQSSDDWDDDSSDEKKPTPAGKPFLPTRTSPAPPPAPRTTSVPSRSPEPVSAPVADEEEKDNKEEVTEAEKEPTPQATPALPTRTSQSTFVPPPPPRRTVPATVQPTEPEEPEESEPENPEPEDPEPEESASPEQGEQLHSAIAEYDNEAEEHNELAFKEGDKIVNIVFVDDDWWLGELEKTGEKGLFPSNYVQLVE